MSLHDLGLMVLLLAPAMLMSVLFLITMASEDFSHASHPHPAHADDTEAGAGAVHRGEDGEEADELLPEHS